MAEPTFKVMVLLPKRKRRQSLYRGLSLKQAKDAAIASCYLYRARKIPATFSIEKEGK